VIRAVVDTNVLASGIVRSHPAALPVQVLDLWRDARFTLVLSEHILTELTRTLAQPYFRRRLGEQQVTDMLRLLHQEALITPITVEVRDAATHPEDDIVVATALSAEAEYLVTGDRKLQELGSYLTVTILPPRAFVDLLST
jgi:uncharacterized protein